MPHRLCLALLAALIAVAVPASAHAATISVDDDRQECASAAHTGLQAAVDAAVPGDTIAICPGAYAEGTGAPGTNALTITKSLTIKGAGADLVTISPTRSTPTGGQIAEASPDLKNGLGDIVAIVGGSALPITVNISGVTVDGDGVYSEAGVVFLDAQGSLNRSRVTDVITSDAAASHSQPGGFRSNQHGFGVAHLSAATSTPAGATARNLTLANTRVDRYNKAGLVVDGGGVVDNRVTLRGASVIGRNNCTTFTTDGNCSSPQLIADGPLFGQDGVQVLGGATLSMVDTLVSQNQVNGTGAPARTTGATPNTTNNANLTLGSGIRLVDAAASTATRSNITDNAYGVINVEEDGTTANTAVPFEAENNWWGLRYLTGTNNPTTNPGPAVSPAYNPPIPENPVNGTETNDGGRRSDTVDFSPHRSGFQGDPENGEFTIASAPMPVNDEAPSVGLSADRSSVERGGVVTLSATPADDFGASQVTFFEGATRIGTAEGDGWTYTVAVPANAACGDRAYTAVVEDSSGQTAASSPVTVSVVNCPSGAPSGSGGTSTPAVTITPTTTSASSTPLAPPSIPGGSLPELSKRGGTVNVVPNAPAGVARVDFFLGGRRLCTVTAAPFLCRVRPTGADVGVQVLRVVVTDRAGQTSESARTVRILRFAPKSLSVRLQQVAREDGRGMTVSGALGRYQSVTVAQGCRSGRVTLTLERGDTALADVQVPLRADCTYRRTLAVPPRRDGVRYTLTARFGGNSVLLPKTKTRRFS